MINVIQKFNQMLMNLIQYSLLNTNMTTKLKDTNDYYQNYSYNDEDQSAILLNFFNKQKLFSFDCIKNSNSIQQYYLFSLISSISAPDIITSVIENEFLYDRMKYIFENKFYDYYG